MSEPTTNAAGRREELRRRFRLDELAPDQGESFFAYPFALGADDVEGHAPLYLDRFVRGDGRLVAESTWRRSGGAPDELLSIVVFACDSRPDARDALLEVLGRVQAVSLLRRVDTTGELAVEAPDASLTAFVRGNLAMVVRSAGHVQVDAASVARAFDRRLVRRDPPSGQPGGGVRVLPGTSTTQGQRIPLRFEDEDDPQSRPLYHKFYSTTGDFQVVNQVVHFTPRGHPASADIVAVGPGGTLARGKLEIP